MRTLRTLATAAALGALGVLATTGTASAGLHDGNLPEGADLPHQTIKVVEEGYNRIVTVAGFHPDPRADDPDPSMKAALERFGEPTSKEAKNAECTVFWEELGLRIRFAGMGARECEAGQAQEINIGGENARGWHTNRDIYIGSSVERTKDKYPARYEGLNKFSLLRQTAPSQGGPTHTTDLLAAGASSQVETPEILSFIIYPLAARKLAD